MAPFPLGVVADIQWRKHHPVRVKMQIFLWVCCTCVILSSFTLTAGEVMTIADEIHPPRIWFEAPIFDKAVSKFTFTYNVSFRVENCCPEIYISGFMSNQSMMSPSRECFSGECPVEDWFNQYHICLKKSSHLSSCEIRNGSYECHGGRTFLSVEERFWKMEVGRHCIDTRELQMRYQVSVNPEINIQCESNPMTTCVEISGTRIIFPNLLGQTGSRPALTLVRHLAVLNVNHQCYQHHQYFTCLAMFQTCNNGVPFSPCRQMCVDFKEGCSVALGKSSWGDNNIQCDRFPDSLDPSVCLYKPVTCPVPKEPIDGSVTYNTTAVNDVASYVCDDGFDLHGEMTGTCLLSGNWNGAVPDCQKRVKSWKFPQYGIAVTCVFILIACVLLAGGCHFRHEIALLVRYHCQRRRSRSKAVSDPETTNQTDKVKLFLTHSNLDCDDVELLVPLIEINLPECSVITYEHDFMPGRPIIDCVMEGVWASDAVMVYLSQSYIDSEWCDFEFNEACRRISREPSFRLVILVNTEPEGIDKLRRIPDKLKTYLRTHIYLSTKEPQFWRKLRVSLLK